VAQDVKSKILQATASQQELREPELTSAVYLFVSFDLINSTHFKTVNQLWPLVLSRFYDVATREAHTNCSELNVWKLVGDEVLFYKVVSSANDLCADLNGIHRALLNCTEALRVAFPKTTGILSVKATAWIAKVDHIGVGLTPEELAGLWNDELLHRNIVIQSPVRPELPDFVGQEIDAGFRISSQSHRNVLVLSADLVMFLREHTTGKQREMDRIKLVSFETLKGVWNGRPYPVLWYYPEWSKIRSTFLYDEELAAGSKYLNALKHSHPNDGNLDLSFLARVYEDLGRDVLIAELQRVVLGSNSLPSGTVEYVPQVKAAELHCVAICFNRQGRVLIAKRPEHKKVAPGAWEFGCAQLSMGLDFEECMRRAYEEDFGIQIENISRLPVSRFFITGKRVPGLIFVAETRSSGSGRFALTKHTDVRWIDPATIDLNALGGCVENFEDTLRAAIDYRSSKTGAVNGSDKDAEPDAKSGKKRERRKAAARS
jgi:hypothetical protein